MVTENNAAIDLPLPYRVFISHGSGDRFIAKQLRTGLQQADPRISCFLDTIDIEAGDNFRPIILREIAQCDEMMVLLTPSSLQRAWIFAEVGAALTHSKRVVGIRYGVDLRELHDRGVVSLIGDSHVIVLDDEPISTYLQGIVRRARRTAGL